MDPCSRQKPFTRNVNLVGSVFVQDVVTHVLCDNVLSVVVEVLDKAHTDHLLEAVAIAAGGGRAHKLPVPEDRFPTPGPQVRLLVVIHQGEVNKLLTDPLLPLLQQCLLPNEVFLQNTEILKLQKYETHYHICADHIE